MKLKNSIVTKTNNIFDLENTQIFIKRDDLLDKKFSGNKARKLSYFLNNNISIKKIISYGSMQSNNMLSMANLSKLKNAEFIYYVNRDIEYINEHKMEGNLRESLKLNMNIIPLNDIEYEKIKISINSNQGFNKNEELFIVEGGFQKEAEHGFIQLSNEINEYVLNNNLKNVKIFIPSGTGTSALYLQKNISFPVYTTNCVSNKKFLEEEFYKLESNSKFHPVILDTKKNYKYGKLYKEHYLEWKNIKEKENLEFELIYDPKGIISIKENKEIFKDSNLIYIHCGGLLGNEIMIKRYLKKYTDLEKIIKYDDDFHLN